MMRNEKKIEHTSRASSALITPLRLLLSRITWLHSSLSVVFSSSGVLILAGLDGVEAENDMLGVVCAEWSGVWT